MIEKIEEIAKSVKHHRQLEIEGSMSNPAIGRSNVNYIGVNQIFWLTNKENIRGRNICDIHGNVIRREIGRLTTLTSDGRAIYKNTKLGEVLILNHEGVHNVITPGGIHTICIYNRASYVPTDPRNEYAKDILIKFSGENKTHSFPDISEIISLQTEINKQREELEHATKEEAEELIRHIAAKEEKMKLYLDKAQGFVRKYAELRYQPILDPIQESIKRSNIFEGTLIINGGPGTGKTTSLIQRIKFLISSSIEEYVSLNEHQKDILYNQATSWIFYSPNELLALFLRNSMKMEELNADTERVKVWSSHKNELIKVYKLINPTTKRPFMIYNKSRGRNLFLNESKSIESLILGFEQFFLELQKSKFDKIIRINISEFRWKNIGYSIQKHLDDKKDISSTNELIRVFLNLNEFYKEEANKIAEEYSKLIKLVAGRIQVIISKDTVRYTSLNELFNQWGDVVQEIESDDEGYDIEIELEDFDEDYEQTIFDFERELFNKLKSLCRKQALRKYDKSTKFSKREIQLIQLIPEVKEQKEYEEIAQAAFFKKYFERITKGIVINIFNEIPVSYKKYRKVQLINKNIDWELTQLGELVKIDRNTRIHPDEQALLLYFINNICFNLFKNYQTQFSNLNHSYLSAYKSQCKPVIGVDEASDFSIVDLLAINSFRHPELSSVTLSGDIMQRMTNTGLTTWEDFSTLVSGTIKKDLEVSYRQSPTLLSLAQAIYEKSTGRVANYKSFIEKDEAEPKPLILISNEEDEKIEWIADRIIEIYKAYGDSIPSIAIFLPKESQLEEFANLLGSLDTLSDVGIRVKASRNGEVLGDRDTVRVFSIDKIKGLEFQAVFFHNLDELLEQNIPNDLLLKYLYVGLSRATFYLGLTVSKQLDDDLRFILDNFDSSGATWKN